MVGAATRIGKALLRLEEIKHTSGPGGTEIGESKEGDDAE